MTKKDWAKYYHGQGWCIIPAKGKIPQVKWQDYQNTKPTLEQIEKWWSENPDYNIALITGAISGVVVVDIDGVTIPSHLPPTAVVQTSPGRFHYYFKHPGKHLKNAIGELMPGVDFKADGGIVILPPSNHFDKEGNPDGQYLWLLPPKQTGFADLPSWIFERLDQKKTVEQISQGVFEGSRNVDTASYVGYLLSQTKNLEELQPLWELVKSWNQTHAHPPQEDRVLWATFNGLLEKEKEQRGIKPQGFLFQPKLLSELSTESLKIDWVWHGFLAQGHLTLFSALWKAGKTTLITNLIKAMEEKDEFVGQKIERKKILVVSEESEGLWARRREEHEINSPVWVLCRPIRQRLNYKEWISLLEQLAQFCIENEIEVFILDTLSTFWNVDNENDAARVQAALLPLNHLLENKVAVLLIHHFRKSGGEEAVASRGSGALASYADVIMEFTRMAQDLESSKRVLKSYSRFAETPVEVVIELTDEGYQVLGSVGDVAKMAKLQMVINLLKQSPEGATTSELYDSQEEDGQITLRTIQRRINELKKLGKVKEVGERLVGKSKTTIWQLTDDTYIEEGNVVARSTHGNSLDRHESSDDKTPSFNTVAGSEDEEEGYYPFKE